MAKNNARRENNYFSKNIQRGGVSFLQMKTPTDLQRDAMIILRELGKGRIDVKKYAEYLYNPQLMAAVLLVAGTKYNYYRATSTSVTTNIQLMQSQGQVVDQIYHTAASEEFAKAEFFRIVSWYYECFKNSGGDANHLIAIPPHVRNSVHLI